MSSSALAFAMRLSRPPAFRCCRLTILGHFFPQRGTRGRMPTIINIASLHLCHQNTVLCIPSFLVSLLPLFCHFFHAKSPIRRQFFQRLRFERAKLGFHQILAVWLAGGSTAVVGTRFVSLFRPTQNGVLSEIVRGHQPCG